MLFYLEFAPKIMHKLLFLVHELAFLFQIGHDVHLSQFID